MTVKSNEHGLNTLAFTPFVCSKTLEELPPIFRSFSLLFNSTDTLGRLSLTGWVSLFVPGAKRRQTPWVQLKANLLSNCAAAVASSRWTRNDGRSKVWSDYFRSFVFLYFETDPTLLWMNSIKIRKTKQWKPEPTELEYFVIKPIVLGGHGVALPLSV